MVGRWSFSTQWHGCQIDGEAHTFHCFCAIVTQKMPMGMTLTGEDNAFLCVNSVFIMSNQTQWYKFWLNVMFLCSGSVRLPFLGMLLLIALSYLRFDQSRPRPRTRSQKSVNPATLSRWPRCCYKQLLLGITTVPKSRGGAGSAAYYAIAEICWEQQHANPSRSRAGDPAPATSGDVRILS